MPYSTRPKHARGGRPSYRSGKPSTSGWRADYMARMYNARNTAAKNQPEHDGGEEPTRADYAEEGRRLLASVNLEHGTESKPSYTGSSAIFRSPQGGGTLHVGNAKCATSREKLDAIGVTRIVYCQDRDEGRMPFGDDPNFRYLAFEIGQWHQSISTPGRPNPAEVRRYFKPLFKFVEESLLEGRGVLIHCLAGAHRAGTAGVACLMYLCGLDHDRAIRTAQAARPAINPIGDFPKLLRALGASGTLKKVQNKCNSGLATGVPKSNPEPEPKAQPEPEPEPEPQPQPQREPEREPQPELEDHLHYSKPEPELEPKLKSARSKVRGAGSDSSRKRQMLRKFTQQYRVSHARALREIRAGRKRSCWSWWVWPTTFKPGSSGRSREWALTEELAAVFLADAHLRACWVVMMGAVAEQLEAGLTLPRLCGVDAPRVPASCDLFHRAAVTLPEAEAKAVRALCARVLRAAAGNGDDTARNRVATQ